MPFLSSDLTPIAEDFLCSGLLENARYSTDVRFLPVCKVIDGEIDIGEQRVTLRLVLHPHFPNRLPSFFLVPNDALGIIPHVDDMGLICYLELEGLLLDRTRPQSILTEALERVVNLLHDGLTGRNWADFADEFEVYWGRLSGGLHGASLIKGDNVAREVWIALQRKPQQFWIADRRGESFNFTGRVQPHARLTQQRALYLPLESGTVLVPPPSSHKFETIESVRDYIVPYLSNANQQRLEALVQGRSRYKEYVVIRLPRPSGGYNLFGFCLQSKSTQYHPLHRNGIARNIVPLQIERQDVEYLVPRGGGLETLTPKRVAVIGCGAVGGHLAFELARAGVGHLTLVDPEHLEPSNTYRHVLGARYWDQSKVKGLKQEIESNLPYADVTVIEHPIETILTVNPSAFAGFDLIVLALGSPTIELALNEHFRTLPNSPPLLFTWLEPMGIGGHALVTGQGDQKGCFECLYTTVQETGSGLVNRAAFAAQDQSFGRALSGCGSLFTPYGSIDVMRTVALAAQQSLHVLTGQEPGNPLRSWKGDASPFTDAGYRLSGRYQISEEEMARMAYTYQQPNCRICGSAALAQAA
jgi:molybdopterin-synthase adenylyltransferase